MPPPRRPFIPLPALWIAVSTFAVSLAAAASLNAGIFAALIVGFIGAARKALAGRSVRAPCGFDVRLDAENQYLHKPAVIGRMDEKNFIWPVWTSPTLIAPEPWSQWLPKNAEARFRRAG